MSSTHEQISLVVRESALLLSRIDALKATLGRVSESSDRRERQLLATIANLTRQLELRAAYVGNLQEALDDKSKFISDAVSSLFAERLRIQEEECARAEAEWRAWQVTAPRAPLRPLRRNRPSKFFDRTVARIPFVGSRVVLLKSGLWRQQFRILSTRSNRGRPLSLAAVTLFDRRDTLAVFDGRLYASNARQGGPYRLPLSHYIAYGALEAADPHPLFSNSYYLEQNAPSIAATGLTPLQHFLFQGAYAGANPHPLFDIRYYVGQVGARALGTMNPLVHYVLHGWKTGLSPHPLFDPASYVQRYPDVSKSHIPALIHYVTHGGRELRAPHPLFDAKWYVEQYSVDTQRITPLEDFVRRGRSHMRAPNRHFDTPFYFSQSLEAQRAANPLLDYLQRGAWVGLTPFKEFPLADVERWRVADMMNGMTPLESWLWNSQMSVCV